MERVLCFHQLSSELSVLLSLTPRWLRIWLQQACSCLSSIYSHVRLIKQEKHCAEWLSGVKTSAQRESLEEGNGPVKGLERNTLNGIGVRQHGG